MTATLNPTSALSLPERIEQFVALFRSIAKTSMAGVPLCNPLLQVETVGFVPWQEGALGLLLAPWCMNLVWFPLRPDFQTAQLGKSRTLRVGNFDFSLIGAFADGFGAYGACSLFSPMFDFSSQAQARATALAILDQLRLPAPPPAPAVLARRAFLLGKTAQGVRP